MLSSYGIHEFLADATLLIHGVFVLFVVGGQFLIMLGWARKWMWTRGVMFRLFHLAAIGFVVLQVWIGVVCPLTTLENYFRTLAGVASYEGSFIGYWLNRLLFYSATEWVFSLVYSGFFLLVLVTFFVYPPRFRRAV